MKPKVAFFDFAGCEGDQLQVANNLGFLRQCINRIASIEFIDRDSERGYLAIQRGSFEITDEALFRKQLADPQLRETLEILAPDLLDPDLPTD